MVHCFKTTTQGEKILVLISIHILNSIVYSKLTQEKTQTSNMTVETFSNIRTFVQTWNRSKTVIWKQQQ